MGAQGTCHEEALLPNERVDQLSLEVGTVGAFLMNEWSFSQLFDLAALSKENGQSPFTGDGFPVLSRDSAQKYQAASTVDV